MTLERLVVAAALATLAGGTAVAASTPWTEEISPPNRGSRR